MGAMVPKITPLLDLAGIGGILCHGCFDVLHIGHIRHLEAARAMRPEGPLTVTITADRFISKGHGRPVFPAADRAQCLAALACVDHVAICEESTGLSAIDTIRPVLYVKGKEYEHASGVSAMEREAVLQYGGTMAYTDRWHSTTAILERLSV